MFMKVRKFLQEAEESGELDFVGALIAFVMLGVFMIGMTAIPACPAMAGEYKEKLPYVKLVNPPLFMQDGKAYPRPQTMRTQHHEVEGPDDCKMPLPSIMPGVTIQTCQPVQNGKIMCLYQMGIQLPIIGKFLGLIVTVRENCHDDFKIYELRLWPYVEAVPGAPKPFELEKTL